MLDELLDRAEGPPLLLVLDGVTDPHNLGACLRTADAAGALAVIVPKDKSATLNATVRKVACGAAEVIPLVAVTNLARTLEKLQQKGLWVVGTAGEAEQSLYAQDLTGPIVLVMGAEGRGMRRLTREHCDYLCACPWPEASAASTYRLPPVSACSKRYVSVGGVRRPIDPGPILPVRSETD